MSASPAVQTVQLWDLGKLVTLRICSTQCTRTSSKVTPSAQWTSGSTTTMQSTANPRHHRQSLTTSTRRVLCIIAAHQVLVLRVLHMSLILPVGGFSWICKLVSQMIARANLESQAIPAVAFKEEENITQLAQPTRPSVDLAHRRRHPHRQRHLHHLRHPRRQRRRHQHHRPHHLRHPRHLRRRTVVRVSRLWAASALHGGLVLVRLA